MMQVREDLLKELETAKNVSNKSEKEVQRL